MAIILIYDNKRNLAMQYSDNFVKITPLFDRLGKEVNKNAQYSVAVDIRVEGGFPRYYYDETSEKLSEEEIAEIKEMARTFGKDE